MHPFFIITNERTIFFSTLPLIRYRARTCECNVRSLVWAPLATRTTDKTLILLQSKQERRATINSDAKSWRPENKVTRPISDCESVAAQCPSGFPLYSGGGKLASRRRRFGVPKPVTCVWDTKSANVENEAIQVSRDERDPIQ